VRPGAAHRAPPGTKVIETIERPDAVEAARGTDIVLHALNPRLADWQRFVLPHAYAAIEAAESAGATLMFPGNLYNYGAGMPPVLDETTPMQPSSRQGRLRVEIEELMREASERGVRTMILRAGDFFGSGYGSWFDLTIVREIRRGIVRYPGPPDVMHEWAYVPDIAAAMVRLAAVRDRLDRFETFGFPGHAVTGRELAGAIAKALGRQVRTKPMSWPLVRALSFFVPVLRELSDVAYLWSVPHRIAGDKLRSVIGEVPHTPFDAAVRRALRDLGIVR
jgi:nucleoside-diphosphate-sugar epimerase